MTKKIVYAMIVTTIIWIGVNLYYYETFGEDDRGAGVQGITRPGQQGIGDQITNQLQQQYGFDPDSVDGTIAGAKDFLGAGSHTPIQHDELKETSNFIFNLLLAFAMIAAVIIGMVIGMKFMVASIEEKAKVKEALVPYVAGCVVVFGAFGIWKLAVIILSSW